MPGKTSSILLVGGILLHSLVAFGSDASALEKLEEAKKLFADRTDPVKVEKALTKLSEAEGEAEDPLIQYHLLVQDSRTLFWKARHIAETVAKKSTHMLGHSKAEQAKNLFPDYAEAYYWMGTHLSRWMEVATISESLAKKPELDKAVNAIYDRDTEEGELGQAYEQYGADRIAGRVYFKAPPFAGGSLQKALTYLEKAYLNGKTYAMNVNFYAEAVYAKGKPVDKELAKKMLDELLAQNPNTLNPARIPETIEEFEEGRKLRSQMN